MEQVISLEEVRTMAIRAGLINLTDVHLQQLLRATQNSGRKIALLPTATLAPTDEPANTFRLNI